MQNAPHPELDEAHRYTSVWGKELARIECEEIERQGGVVEKVQQPEDDHWRITWRTGVAGKKKYDWDWAFRTAYNAEHGF